MVVGKPNFNLNSFGIEYFVKREGEKIGNKKELGESKQLTDRGTRSSRINVPNASSTGGIKSRPHPKLFGQPKTEEHAVVKEPPTITSQQNEPKAIPTKDTKTYWTPEKNPKENIHQRSFDSKETSGFVNQKIKPLHGKDLKGNETSKPDEGIAPKIQRGGLGTMNEKIPTPTGQHPTMNTLSSLARGKKDKEKQPPKIPKGGKNLPSQTGDAPTHPDNILEKVPSKYDDIADAHSRSGSGGREVEVGVGLEQHKRFQAREGVGEYKEHKTHEATGGAKGRPKTDLNSQHKQSSKVRDHNKRGKTNQGWYSKDQKTAFNKIDPADRNAQAAYHTEQEKEYDKSVDTPKEMSDAGKKLLAGVGKSNEIIRDMDIMKLDLMKVIRNQAPFGSDVGGTGDIDSDTPVVTSNTKFFDQNGKQHATKEAADAVGQKTGRNLRTARARRNAYNADTRQTIAQRTNIKLSASETIFKAILLKLDLMNKGKGNFDGKTGKINPEIFKEPNDGSRIHVTSDNKVLEHGGNKTLEHIQNLQTGKKSGDTLEDLGKSAAETIFKAISLKLDLMNKLNITPKGVKGERYVRGNRQSAGKNPAFVPQNAGGVQNKLETMQDESPTLTDEDIKRQKENSETGATETDKKVADRYQ